MIYTACENCRKTMAFHPFAVNNNDRCPYCHVPITDRTVIEDEWQLPLSGALPNRETAVVTTEGTVRIDMGKARRDNICSFVIQRLAYLQQALQTAPEEVLIITRSFAHFHYSGQASVSSFTALCMEAAKKLTASKGFIFRRLADEMILKMLLPAMLYEANINIPREELPGLLKTLREMKSDTDYTPQLLSGKFPRLSEKELLETCLWKYLSAQRRYGILDHGEMLNILLREFRPHPKRYVIVEDSAAFCQKELKLIKRLGTNITFIRHDSPAKLDCDQHCFEEIFPNCTDVKI